MPTEVKAPEPADQDRILRAGCRRWLSGHRPIAPAARLAALARLPEADLAQDFYGQGGAHDALQDVVADLLGKPAAVFLPKGVIAQLAILRTWADRANRDLVALHPRSHVAVDEAEAYAVLHGLRGVKIGRDHAPFDLADLAAISEPLAAMVIELPLRRAAFSLPAWDELAAMSRWAGERGVARHLDGARLWEAGPGLGRDYAQISSLFDSVYVSFYKGLGGLGGAALAGEADLLAEVRVWLHRHGAHPYTAFPYALAALDGLRRHLPRMEEYRQRAAHLAKLLADAGHRVSVAQTNAFQIWLPGSPSALLEANRAIARASGVWLLEGASATAAPGLSMSEIQVGEAAADIDDGDLIDFFAALTVTRPGRSRGRL